MNEVQYDDTATAIQHTAYAAVLNAAMQVWDSSVLKFVTVTDALVSQNCCFSLTRLGSSHWLTASLATVGGTLWNGILTADPTLSGSYFVPVFDTTSGNTAGQVGTAAFTALTEVGTASFGSNATTGPTYILSGVVPIGGLSPLPIVIQQYCAFNVTIPLTSAIINTDNVVFAVTSMTNRNVILWQQAGTVAGNGLSVTVAQPATNTQTIPPNGWYWYLVDTTTMLPLGEGPLTLQPAPNV